MIGMQYNITLPNDYDMKIIRKRIQHNGAKTDGFPDLLFKAYLLMDYPQRKEYAPLYLWKSNEGMNQFIFNGFYDNILHSFGWQQINIAIPYKVELSNTFTKAKYVLVIEQEMPQVFDMNQLDFPYSDPHCLGRVLVYNPDKWRYVAFYFYQAIPETMEGKGSIYELVHLSM
ncbi:DUF4865 family protein [Isobaculum melis]|uniref:DUF4865 domain-containing protein n=1 Tax=Isobaculum melis TaxID=142588 RepID=A0A1H9PSS0_9LACT|nr:DUF4865 family protein [Isobaculum melis]SER51274.1 protein of unknown function [Isobaculum melis]